MATKLYSIKCRHCNNNIGFKDYDIDTQKRIMTCTKCFREPNHTQRVKPVGTHAPGVLSDDNATDVE